MAREIYSLTDATKDVLTDCVKTVAGAMGKADKYLYAILSEDKTDPFAPFESLYKGVLKAGLSTCHWDNHLEFHRYRFGGGQAKTKDAAACFAEKLNVHALTLTKFIEAFSDGELDTAEIKTIETCLDREEKNIAAIRAMLNFRKSLVSAS